MKRAGMVVIALAFIVAIQGFVLSVGQPEIGAALAAAKDPGGLIAFSVSTTSNPFYATMAQGVRDEAKSAGFEVLVLDAQNKIDKQTSDVEDALTKNIKALLINGVDDGAKPLALKAMSKGIPVIALQRNLDEQNAHAFIGTNNVVLGEQLIADRLFAALAQVLPTPNPNSPCYSEYGTAAWRSGAMAQSLRACSGSSASSITVTELAKRSALTSMASRAPVRIAVSCDTELVASGILWRIMTSFPVQQTPTTLIPPEAPAARAFSFSSLSSATCATGPRATSSGSHSCPAGPRNHCPSTRRSSKPWSTATKRRPPTSSVIRRNRPRGFSLRVKMKVFRST